MIRAIISKEHILEVLNKHWNIGPASKELGVGYSTLRKYIKQYNIDHNSRKNKNGLIFDRKIHQSKAVTKSRQNKKIQALEYKGGMVCIRCGFSEPIPDCYSFHHREPGKKDPSWAKMKTNNWGFEKLKKSLINVMYYVIIVIV